MQEKRKNELDDDSVRVICEVCEAEIILSGHGKSKRKKQRTCGSEECKKVIRDRAVKEHNRLRNIRKREEKIKGGVNG